MADRAMTPVQVAERYGVSPDKVRSRIASGELQAIDVSTRRGGRPRWVVTPEALAAWERQRVARPTQRPQRRRRQPDVIEYF